MDPNLQFDSLSLHGGHQPDRKTRSRAVPIHQTTRYVFDSAEHGAALFRLAEPGNIYTQLMNPATDVLEKRVAALEVGRAAMRSFRPRLWLLGTDTDRLFDTPLVTELATAARSARVDVDLGWLTSLHEHDAFLIEWTTLRARLADALPKEDTCA